MKKEGTHGLTEYQQSEMTRRLELRLEDETVEDADYICIEDLAELFETSASTIYRMVRMKVISPIRGSKSVFRVGPLLDSIAESPESWSRPRNLVEPESGPPLVPIFSSSQRDWIDRRIEEAVNKRLADLGYLTGQTICGEAGA